MVVILVTGIANGIKLRKETFPSFEAQNVRIEIPIRGSTPEDVERGVATKVEEAMKGIDGINHITSTSRENGATITIEALDDYPIQKLLDDVKIRVDSIPRFPAQAEKPIISEQRRRNSVLWIAVHGQASEVALKETARELRDQLLKLPNISQVQLFGSRDYEISIEVSEDRLRTYGLTFDEVSTAVSANSLDLGGGLIRSSRGEISIRSRAQAYKAIDFAQLPLRTAPDGTRILLKDVAEIRDGFVDQEFLTQFDGSPAIALEIKTEGRDDIIKSAKLARQAVENFRATASISPGISITTWNDGSAPIRSRLGLLLKNGLVGVLLVLIVLSLFLNLRLAFWVALGIPVSIAGALVLFPLPGIDVSLNQLTAFAFIVVLGIVVDDAIVIGESVYATKEAQGPGGGPEAPLRATVRGVSRVLVPSVFGVLTTIAAFYPLTNVSGHMGNAFGQIAIAVIFCLIFSLIESKIILPSHLAHIDVHRKPGNPIARTWSRFQDSVSRGLRHFITKIYQPALRAAFPYRYVVTAVFIAIFVFVAALIPAGKLRFVFFPNIYRDSLAATLELEQGLPVEHLHNSARRITDSLIEVTQQLEQQHQEKILIHAQISSSSSTKAAIAAELTPSEQRVTTTEEIINAWRKKVGPISGAKALSYSATTGPPGQGLSIQLESKDLDALQTAANELKAKVATFPGIHDVRDTFDAGQPEIQISLTPDGEAAGLDRRTLALNLRDAFYGREAQRVQRDRDEVRVMVRYPRAERNNLDSMREMRVRTADGTAVPFSIVADTQYGKALASIQRADFNRIVSVQAYVDKSTTSGDDVIAELETSYFNDFRSRFPGVNISLRGEAEQRMRSFASLRSGLLLSIVLIYILLAIPLKSYTRPLFIMSVIPFGIIGAVLGHFIVGIPVSILSLFGILALSGVVVNDSLVLIHRLDSLIAEQNLNLADALDQAVGERFRAILLTSLTTFAGLIPLLAETAVQAQFLKPMAVSLGFGVLFATVITLVLLPMLLLIAQDISTPIKRSLSWWSSLITGRQTS